MGVGLDVVSRCFGVEGICRVRVSKHVGEAMMLGTQSGRGHGHHEAMLGTIMSMVLGRVGVKTGRVTSVLHGLFEMTTKDNWLMSLTFITIG